MPHIALDKKSNFEYLEKEVGLHKFLPRNVINTNKPKPLRKLIQLHFKKYAVLGDLECIFKFFEILKTVYRFDQERYRCALGVSLCALHFAQSLFSLQLQHFIVLLYQTKKP
jgi:focal adhesion kinase 1